MINVKDNESRNIDDIIIIRMKYELIRLVKVLKICLWLSPNKGLRIHFNFSSVIIAFIESIIGVQNQVIEGL